MIVYGGKDNESNKLADVWSFDMNSAQWTELKGRDAPKGRSGHTASLYNDHMVVFGGIYEIT